eukprot:TRINITY_DN859_c0_g1_i9.p1 TRINITY_DN859_c0_g1~~TRINITY_DN859_c0_g1_i9.p1  ORF type:complete len:111 (-),score=3.84 TRINITY_DN859_c0_g1_i9:4-336(-)
MVASPTHISTSTSSFNCWTVIVGDTLSGREFFPTTMYTLSCFSSSFSIFKDNTNFRQRILGSKWNLDHRLLYLRLARELFVFSSVYLCLSFCVSDHCTVTTSYGSCRYTV